VTSLPGLGRNGRGKARKPIRAEVRNECEARGEGAVRAFLANQGGGSFADEKISRFGPVDDLHRWEIEQWLKERSDAKEVRDASVACWTKVAAIAAIVAAVLAAVGIFP
jgi:hypothetical protein